MTTPSASVSRFSSSAFREQQLLILRYGMIQTEQTVPFWSDMKLKFNSLSLSSQN